jgi:hypothetical protein
MQRLYEYIHRETPSPEIRAYGIGDLLWIITECHFFFIVLLHSQILVIPVLRAMITYGLFYFFTTPRRQLFLLV